MTMPPDDNAQPTSGDALGGVRAYLDPVALAFYRDPPPWNTDVWVAIPQVRAATLEAVVAAAREYVSIHHLGTDLDLLIDALAAHDALDAS